MKIASGFENIVEWHCTCECRRAYRGREEGEVRKRFDGRLDLVPDLLSPLH